MNNKNNNNMNNNDNINNDNDVFDNIYNNYYIDNDSNSILSILNKYRQNGHWSIPTIPTIPTKSSSTFDNSIYMDIELNPLKCIVTDFEIDDAWRLIMELTDMVNGKLDHIDFILVNVGEDIELKALTLLTLMEQFDIIIPIFIGKLDSKYSNISSNKIARNHKFVDLEDFVDKSLSSKSKLQSYLKIPEYIGDRKVKWEIISPLTEIAELFKMYPYLIQQTVSINLMGGFQPVKNAMRMSYNWSLDPIATKTMIEIIYKHNIPTTLFSSHIIKPQIGMSINEKNAPLAMAEEIKLYEYVSGAIVNQMNLAWNTTVSQIPVVKDQIDKVGMTQHCPADIVSYFGKEIIDIKKKVKIEFVNSENYIDYYDNSKELDAPEILTFDDENSPIELVTEFKKSEGELPTDITPQQKYFYDLYRTKLCEVEQCLREKKLSKNNNFLRKRKMDEKEDEDVNKNKDKYL